MLIISEPNQRQDGLRNQSLDTAMCFEYKPIELLETPKANQTTAKIPVDNKDI